MVKYFLSFVSIIQSEEICDTYRTIYKEVFYAI